jgi:lipopolysaccharide assembly outer membrane protein LptD (OstA)
LKLLRNLLLIKFLLLLTSVNNQTYAFSNAAFFQEVVQNDSLKRVNSPAQDSTALKRPNAVAGTQPKDSVNGKVEYKADSTEFDKVQNIVYLYGNARVNYQGLELDADFIRFDQKNSTIFARGSKDKNGKYVGRPIFKMELQGTSVADSLLYNTKSGKASVFNVFSEQEGGFFSGGRAKKQPDNEVHAKGQTYSTCNLPHPHFGIHITQGIATENQIITGPVYLKIEDIPFPIGLPFAFFPKPNKKASGIILPTPGEDFTRGFFLRDGGYYLGLNDYWDAKILGTIFTRGSYEGSLLSNYTKRYKYNGNVNLRYANSRYGLEGTPEYGARKDFSIQWSHSQNANARPGTTFSASVNAQTSSFNENTAGGNSFDPNKIAENQLRSSISYGRVFGNGLFNLSSSLGHSQDTKTKMVNLSLPELSLNMSTLNPFDSKDRVGEQKWYQKITVGYSMQASNSVTTADSVLFKKETLSKFNNGMSHSIPINMAFNVLKYFNFNTGVNYMERWHLQSIRKTYIKQENGDLAVIDTIAGFNRSGQYSLSMGMSTKVYSTAQFRKLGNFKALRHVMTPSASFSYQPDFSSDKFGNYKNAYYIDGTAAYESDGRTPRRYSIHEGSLYGGPGAGQNASISFSLDNTVEAKILSPKDTTGTGERKLPIIQGLGISGSYNFLAKKEKLSQLGFNGRSQFSEKLGVNYYGSLNPYAVKDVDSTINGERQIVRVVNSDRYVWEEGRLPRLTSFGFSFDYSLNPDALKKKNQNLDAAKDQATQSGMTPEQAEALNKISRDPNAFVDFTIPWNFAFSYSFQYNTEPNGRNSSISNTLNFNGDANITPKWKVQFTSGWDFRANTFSQTSFSIYRDLHCWDMSMSWIPFGQYQSYSVDIKVKASILQDLKLSKRKAYYTRF